MEASVVIAIISGVVTIILAAITFFSLKATLKNNKDLALITAGQLKIDDKIEKYHKEVDGKMGQLLEVTGAAKKAEGVIEGKEINQAETDAKPQEKK
jgi:hypothetical protein